MALSSADLPSNALPAESPQLGDGSATSSSRRQLQSAGSPGRAAGPGAAPPQPGPPPGGQQGPVQPEPRQPLTQADMAPGGRVFMKPQLAPPPSWRMQLRIWGAHPEANIIRRLSQRADAGLPFEPPQPGAQHLRQKPQ